MTELVLDGGERLDGSARLLKLNETPDGACVTVSIPDQRGIVAVLDKAQQRRLVAYLAKQLWPLETA
jgi:hypothetical protein